MAAIESPGKLIAQPNPKLAGCKSNGPKVVFVQWPSKAVECRNRRAWKLILQPTNHSESSPFGGTLPFRTAHIFSIIS